MKSVFIIGFVLSMPALAEGYYYPVPPNPPAIQYVLPPAYIVPPQQNFIPPPIYAPSIQRGYIAPPPQDWANSKFVPRPPRTNMIQEK